MRIALLCSGLGNVHRGHEVFARDLFNLIGDAVDITLFKGGGEPLARERMIDNIPRDSAYLDHIHVSVSPKWESAVREQERTRIEAETFAYAALKPLLEGGFDVIHCLEKDVCNIIYDHRHLFKDTPKIVFSNGGAIPAWDLPHCDFVQEHTEHNLRYSAKKKAFMIPHGVDLKRFNPQVESDFRALHGIPQDAFVVISVGTICYWHKRMDYVIKEVAALKDVYLLIVGQESKDTPEIKELGKRLMGDRIIFITLPHDELPNAYATADVFVLGSLFETFGIVYIEAMAMGLPVICTNHVNQRSIVKEGIFIDMSKPGALTHVLQKTNRDTLAAIGKRGREVAVKTYDLILLKRQYLTQYQAVASAQVTLPTYSLKMKVLSNIRNLVRQMAWLIYGRAE
ncbi:MAG: glycosyltransferase family 4 protein [Candidatus Competibacter sp.]|nr:glycosyltransferase family 4 protein [Candidatus Competibacter sp.]